MLSSFHGPDNVTSPTSPTALVPRVGVTYPQWAKTMVPRVGVTYPQWAKTTKCVLDFLKHWRQVLYTLISLPNTKYNAWCWKMPHKHWMNECHLPYIYGLGSNATAKFCNCYSWRLRAGYPSVTSFSVEEIAEHWGAKASMIPSCVAVLLWDNLVQTVVIQGRERARLGWCLREGLYSRQRELLSPRHCLSKEWSLQDIMICTLSKPSQLVSICTGVTFSDMSGMKIHM